MTDLVATYSKKFCKPSVPELKPGYQVRVHQKIKEGNKERVQVFEGMIIRKNAGQGVSETFTVRKISEGIGVEKIFPIHSPTIVKIDVVRAHKVRRAKLHYLRDLSGKALRLKEVELKLEEKKFEVAPAKKEEAVDTPEITAEAPPPVAEIPTEPVTQSEETSSEELAAKNPGPAATEPTSEKDKAPAVIPEAAEESLKEEAKAETEVSTTEEGEKKE